MNNREDKKESEIDKLIRELDLQEINQDDDIKLEFDEIEYNENEEFLGEDNKEPNKKFNKIMNIILCIGGTIILILLICIIIGSSREDVAETQAQGETVYVDGETTTVDIDRPDTLDQATTKAAQTTTEATEPSTEEETTTQLETTTKQETTAPTTPPETTTKQETTAPTTPPPANEGGV